MAVVPHSIDIVVADMGRALAYYRDLGLEAPASAADEDQVQIHTEGGAAIGLLTETMMRRAYPDWVTPVGRRVTFGCRCDTVEELDATWDRMLASGHAGLKAPWDSFWGQRYAMLEDPDGNRVDLFTPIAPAGEE